MKIAVEVNLKRANGFNLAVDFSCETAVLGIVGPSGCGKSTLLNSISGIESGAKVILDGIDLSKTPIHRRGIGYVTQDSLLFPHLTVKQNLLYSPSAAHCEEVAKALRISHLLERMPRHLSGGEKRRVALARAIISQPKLLLLDEPFGGLDDLSRREAISLVCEINRRFKIPMIIVSHFMEEVIGLAELVIRLEQGKVVEQGASIALLRANESRVDNYFIGEVIGEGKVKVGEVELQLNLPAEANGLVRIACYAHDIILSKNFPADTSARNLISAKIKKMTPVGNYIFVELEQAHLKVVITANSLKEMELQTGESVVAVIKAMALTYLGPALV